MSNPLLELIEGGLDHTVHKWHHYLPLYHRHFEKYRGGKVRILEIGVYMGGSLDLWNAYFGKDNCEIYAVDINPDCKRFEKDNVHIFIGDQADTAFLHNLKELLPPLDIIIDDGGHTMVQQINTFDVLFVCVVPGGVYLCEDTHTSYWPDYGGGLENPKTFMEYSKKFIDKLNAYHTNLPIDDFVKTCRGIHYYDSMVFFEKADTVLERPTHKQWHSK